MAEIRARGSVIEVKVDRREREALLQIVDRVLPMVDDSALATPRAYVDDVLEAEFRRLSGPDLDDTRAVDLEVLRSTLRTQGPIELSEDQAWSWLRMLNVLRLALAERLGLAEDGWEDRFSQRQHRRPPLATLHLLSWIQEELVESLPEI